MTPHPFPTLADHLVRVYEIPVETLTDYRFGKGHAVVFKEVDWFSAEVGAGEFPSPNRDADEWERELRPFILLKRYCRPGRSYLVLHPKRCFVVSKPFAAEAEAGQ